MIFMMYLYFAAIIILIRASDLPFTVNSAIQNNMVLQVSHFIVYQRAPHKATLWGTAATASKTTVFIESRSYSTSTDEVKYSERNQNGRWKVFIDPHEEMFNGLSITIKNDKADNTFTFDNIVFGDVFICSGQSNMEYTVIYTSLFR